MSCCRRLTEEVTSIRSTIRYGPGEGRSSSPGQANTGGRSQINRPIDEMTDVVDVVVVVDDDDDDDDDYIKWQRLAMTMTMTMAINGTRPVENVLLEPIKERA
jgi:hypothetical protein